MGSPSEFFTVTELQTIVTAIKDAERRTSGEIRLHLESKLPEDSENALDRAAAVFIELELQKTNNRNGVLFYLAIDDHHLAILGDSGIHRAANKGFWEEEKELILSYFRKGEFVEGLVHGIKEAGERLSMAFPANREDINELPDEVSFGD